MTDARNARHNVRVAWAAYPADLVVEARMQYRVAVDPTVITPTVKTYDGSGFASHPVAYWDGARWKQPTAVKTWNGSSFI